MKMLAALAVVLLVSSVTEGRILSKCELKEQLEAAQIQVIRAMGEKTTVDTFIARLVCNVENTSGFNTSLVTSVQINQNEIRPPFQIPPKPCEKPPAKEEDDEKMEDEHIIPLQPQSHLKERRARSVPEAKTFETQGAKDLFWTWHRGLFPEKVLADSSGSGSEVTSEEDSSGDSSEEEEEREDVIAWKLLGIFQLNDRVACDSGSSGSLNLCGLECRALINDDITDDIACLKTLVGRRGNNGFNPKKRFLAKMLAMVQVKECRSVVPSKYFAECS